MPNGIPVIQDIAVLAQSLHGCNPIGEAQRETDPIPTSLMDSAERKDMVTRLKNSIFKLMDSAEETHKAKGGELDPLFITRLSTNEFFFYTKEPLSMQEFEILQNAIADKAKKLPSGIQFILGSFAVKIEDNLVMNVTPHITCGDHPDFNFIVKNTTSSIDVRYKIPHEYGGYRDTLDVFNLTTYNDKLPMPRIKIKGCFKEFTFNNIVKCKTPGGTKYLTAVDICSDHRWGIAKYNYDKLKKSNYDIARQPVSHVVVSNSIYLDIDSFLSNQIMHVDPLESKKECKQGVRQEINSNLDLEFGKDRIITYIVDATRLTSHLDNTYLYKTWSNDFKRQHGKYEVNLDLGKFNQIKTKYQDAKGDYLKTKILDDFKIKLQNTFSVDELIELKVALKTTREYEILKTGQGWFTRLTGINTSSINALESMFKQQEEYLKHLESGKVIR